jgi:hypothetical protein
MLFKAHFTKLADDQFITALAWGIAALQDAGDPRMRAKEQRCSLRPTQKKIGLCLALVGAIELPSASDWVSYFPA